VNSKGHIYFPTTDGILCILSGANWQQVDMTPLPQYFPLDATDALIDKDDNYWIATYGLGIWKFNGSVWTQYGGIPEKDLPKLENGWIQRPNPSQNNSSNATPSFTFSLAQDLKGQIWVSSPEGIYVKSPNDEWTIYTNESLNLGDRWIDDIAVDSKGRIWAVSLYNLLVFDGTKWQSFKPEVVGAQYWGDAIGFDRHGNAWVSLGSRDSGLATFKEQ
jgi:ligand-binding sensor domain-containing protein